MRTPKKIMDGARGEPCTLNIPGICNYDVETSVMCHLSDGSGGSARLAGPLSIAIGCSACHDMIDGRNYKALDLEFENDREFYLRRGMNRTLNKLIEKGLIKL